jgi:hypothetical protein
MKEEEREEPGNDGWKHHKMKSEGVEERGKENNRIKLQVIGPIYYPIQT